MEKDPSKKHPETRSASKDAIKELCSVLKTLSESAPKGIDMDTSARISLLHAPTFAKKEKTLGNSVYASYALKDNSDGNEGDAGDASTILVFSLNPDKKYGEMGVLAIGHTELVDGKLVPVVVDHVIHTDRVLMYKKGEGDIVKNKDSAEGRAELNRQQKIRNEEDQLGLPIMTEDEVVALTNQLNDYVSLDDPDQWSFDN
jgi:hypothetical protein